MTCPFRLLTFTSLGGAGGSCFLASWSSSFFFPTEISSGVLPELCYCTLRLVLFCKRNFSGDQYIDDDTADEGTVSFQL